MRRARLVQKAQPYDSARHRLGLARWSAAGLALGAALGCEPAPRVSPWGARGGPPIGLFAEAPSLERQLRAIEAEAKAEGLAPYASASLPGRDDARFEVRAFEGKDGLGRRTTAVRVATPFSVILALGPLDTDDPRGAATRFVPALPLGEGTALSLPADLTGDGQPELVVAAETGASLVFTLRPRGATELPVELRGRVLELRRLSQGFALWTRREAEPSPSLTPRLERVAAFEGGKFSEASAAARAWHRAAAARLEAALDDEPAASRLARGARKAFHLAMAAGSDGERDQALEALDGEAVPAELGAAWAETRELLAREVGVDRGVGRGKK